MDTTTPEHYSQNSSVQYSLGVEVLQQYMKWEEGDTVLDAGCGTGEICKYILQQPEVASVVGFDASPDFVSYAMASQHNSSPNVLYHVADVSDASTLKPGWQGAFSKAVSFLVLHWVQDKAAALKALHSCLKPSGEILMTFCPDKDKFVQTNFQMAAHPKWQIYLKDFVHNVFPWPSSDLVNQRSRLLEDCGYQVIAYHLKEHQQPYESKEDLREALRAINPHLRYIPQDKHEEFLDDVEKMARETTFISGDYNMTNGFTVVYARKL
ncbi:Hypp7632 [Branchiostoma lanceolatum]|nr:Hypp7632 [Branchiostoma lanceolatum]